jgi:hypothetical protein
MRYFIVKYMKKANGQMDELVSISKKTKLNDLQTSAVILDFKTQTVVLASLDGKTVPKDFNRICGFYYQHYKNIIDRLCRENGLEFSVEKSTEAE